MIKNKIFVVSYDKQNDMFVFEDKCLHKTDYINWDFIQNDWELFHLLTDGKISPTNQNNSKFLISVLENEDAKLGFWSNELNNQVSYLVSMSLGAPDNKVEFFDDVKNNNYDETIEKLMSKLALSVFKRLITNQTMKNHLLPEKQSELEK